MGRVPKILSINKIESGFDKATWETGPLGYDVVTEKETIKIRMSNEQNCCEDADLLFLHTEDEVQDFIGAYYYGTSVSWREHDAIHTERLKERAFEDDDHTPEYMFVTLETDKGPLQFVCYNSHNGYYAHGVSVECEDLVIKTRI